MNFIAQIDMTNLSYKFCKPQNHELYLGGREITSNILSQETTPTCDPLGSGNVVVIAPGLLTGTTAPSSGRLSLGAKSPLTGGIKESNVGGTFGRTLARIGYKVLKIHGTAPEDNSFLLDISKDGISFVSADHMRGMTNYNVGEYLTDTYGKNISYLCIGPGGENHLPLATVAASDMEGRPTRHAGRGGLGGVLGAKGIKAIILRGHGSAVIPSNRQAFQKIQKTFAKDLVQTKKALKNFGTAVLVDVINEAGALPVNNFRYGRTEHASKISGHVLAENCKNRGGRTGHSCHPGCVIKCSNIYHDSNGKYLTSALEYETIVLMGINCGLTDLDHIAELDFMCDDFGLDTMEVGVTLGVAMEAGVLSFGDFTNMKRLIQEMAYKKDMGKMLGLGAYMAGKELGIKRTPVVKKQAMSAYDPRALKGTGVTYATSPMGADHTAGNCLPGRTGLDDTKAEGHIEASRELQILTTICDMLGLCIFVGPVRENLGIMTKLFNSFTGQNNSENEMINLGLNILQTEIDYNLKAGILPNTNDLPNFFRDEPLPSNLSFDVQSRDLEYIFG